MRFLFLLFTIFISNFSLAKDIKVTSAPAGAEIWVRPMNSLNFQKIGDTPYASSMKDIVDNYTKSEVFIIELRKLDHVAQRYIVSDISNVDFELNAKLEFVDDYAMMLKFDNACQGMFEVQRMIRAKNYEQAIEKADELLKIFPRLSILYELKGSALYLSKNSAKALDLYKDAFKYNPQNFDAFKMKEYLEKNFSTGEKDSQ